MDGSVTEWPKGVQLRAPTVLPSNSLSLQLYHPNPRNSLHQSLTGYPFPPSSHALYHSCGRRTGNISPQRREEDWMAPCSSLKTPSHSESGMGRPRPQLSPCFPFWTMHSCTRPGHAHESPPRALSGRPLASGPLPSARSKRARACLLIIPVSLGGECQNKNSLEGCF